MRKKAGAIVLGVLIAIVVSAGICLYLFSFHDNDDGDVLSKIHYDEQIIQYCYNNENDSYRYGDGWEDYSAASYTMCTDYMREATLIFNGRIEKGEYILKIYDEDGDVVFQHSFTEGDYDHVRFALGNLGHSYYDANMVSLDFNPGTAEWGVSSRCKGYDRIIKKK